jgi:Fibronectin type III domain
LKILSGVRGTGVLALALAALLAGCDDSDGTADASTTPQAVNSQVTRSAPTSASSATSSTGSVPKDSEAGSGNATLSWEAPTLNTNGSALTDLSGYRIYYGPTESEMTKVVQITNLGLQTYVIENLEAGTWYFAVRALTTDGTESNLSDVVSKRIG